MVRGQNKRIVRISMTGNNIIRFSERDGLQGPLFNYQVAAALPPYLYFGGITDSIKSILGYNSTTVLFHGRRY